VRHVIGMSALFWWFTLFDGVRTDVYPISDIALMKRHAEIIIATLLTLVWVILRRIDQMEGKP
jgi:hypothetical protein